MGSDDNSKSSDGVKDFEFVSKNNLLQSQISCNTKFIFKIFMNETMNLLKTNYQLSESIYDGSRQELSLPNRIHLQFVKYQVLNYLYSCIASHLTRVVEIGGMHLSALDFLSRCSQYRCTFIHKVVLYFCSVESLLRI